MKLSHSFQLTENQEVTHCWVLSTHDSSWSPINTLAEMLADRIVEMRCVSCPQHYEAWRLRFSKGAPLSVSSKAALNAFLGPVFGTLGEPDSVPKDHLEGYVSEALWYFLSLENPSEEIVRVEPPGFKPTDPGGDGLIVHRIASEDYLMFRLWETKKCVPSDGNKSGAVSATVNNAYRQLHSNAIEYLARYTVIGQELADEELADFYGQLPDLWIEASHQAAAGVCVTVSSGLVPSRCFTTFGKNFPAFVDPLRLRGMLTAVDDFSTFARQVQVAVWKGL